MDKDNVVSKNIGDKKEWYIRDIVNYAIDRFNLSYLYNNNNRLLYDAIEKKIRRTMKEYNMYRHEENASDSKEKDSPSTEKETSILQEDNSSAFEKETSISQEEDSSASEKEEKPPAGKLLPISEKEVKALVDVLLYDYFTERQNQAFCKQVFLKKDEEANIRSANALREWNPLDYSNDDEFCDYPTEEEIDASIQKFMVRALFNLFYDFDEKSYREDYISRTEHLSLDEMEPYLPGYSELNEKLTHPVQYYCTRRQ